MAICPCCNQDMLQAATCRPDDLWIEGIGYDPIPYGGGQWGWHVGMAERCHDCNCIQGGFHHPGCDMEECPKCHGQLISCDCRLDDDDEDDDELAPVGPDAPFMVHLN